MHFFKSDELSVKNNKKILIGSVVPRPIALVSTQSSEGVINLGPFSYFNVVTYDPPIVSISVIRRGDRMKDTVRNILDRGEAVIHVVDESILEETNRASIDNDYNESELEFSGFTLEPSQLINTPGLKEPNIRFETKLYDRHIIKDHEGNEKADLVLLEVVGSHIADEVYDVDNHYILPKDLNPMSRLAGNDYGKLGDIVTIKRPKKEI